MGAAKQALAPKHTATTKDLGSTPKERAVEMATGTMRTAVALLLRSCVVMLVSRMIPPRMMDGSKSLRRNR